MQLIYNVVLISGVQQSDPVMYLYIFFYILFHYDLSQDIEYSSLCCTVGPCCWSSLHIIVCIPKLPIQPSPISFPLGKRKSVLYVCEPVSVLQTSSFVLYFRFHMIVYGICLFFDLKVFLFTHFIQISPILLVLICI